VPCGHKLVEVGRLENDVNRFAALVVEHDLVDIVFLNDVFDLGVLVEIAV
jgi:hypothetical protein